MSTLKSEVVGVRVEPHIKGALQSTAEREMRSLVNMVEVMVVAYCWTHDVPLCGVSKMTLPATKLRKQP